MNKAIIIGVSEDYSKYFFKVSADNDFSFTPWDLETTSGCVHDQCLTYLNDHIFYDRYECDIYDLDYVCSQENLDTNDKTDIFIYKTDEFLKINCDFLIYNEKTLDYEFNLIHSWIVSYIYNKYQRKGTVYYF